MAKDKAAYVARQAAVSRHGAGLGSRRAQGRWGKHAGARRASVARASGGRWVGALARASGSWAQAQAGGSGTRGARSRALGARQGAGHVAWTSGLALGCALGALGLFSIRFDSILFLSRFLDVVCEPGS